MSPKPLKERIQSKERRKEKSGGEKAEPLTCVMKESKKERNHLMSPSDFRLGCCGWSWKGNRGVEKFSKAGVGVMGGDFVLAPFPS